MLRAESISVGYPGREPGTEPVVGPLDCAVAPGEWLTICGGNGAGKTAVALTLAGLLPPAAGRVLVEDVDLHAAASRGRLRSRIGMVFQEPETQFVCDRVDRELAFPLENLGWERPAIAARVRDLLAEFDLLGLAAAPPSRLSGGEMQRVALATACAANPSYLVLDEPTSYLDDEAASGLRAWIEKACRKRHCGVIWTALEAAETPAADRVLDLGPSPLAAPLPASAPAAPGNAGALLWRGRDLYLVRRDEGGESHLWRGLSFEIRAGERLVVTGRNGSGKTSLLDALAGWAEPTAGHLERPDRARIRLGYLQQFPEDQLFAPTVLEDVGFGARHLQRGAREGLASEALARVGLDPGRFAALASSALSLGERRRVALAGVLATAPGAILLDEPSVGLDRAGRRALAESLDRASGQGQTLVVATQSSEWGSALGASLVTLLPPRPHPRTEVPRDS